MPLRVRYGSLLPLALGFMGASQLFLAWSRSVSGRDATIQFIIGVLGLGLAFMMNKAPYFIVDNTSLKVNGLGGFLSRTYRYGTLVDLQLDGDQLRYREGEQWKKLPISKSISKAEDWGALVTLLSEQIVQ